MPLTFSLMEIDKIQEILPFFSDFFSIKTLANPHKIRYIQKVGLIGALYEPRENLIMITVDKETRKIEFYKKHEGDKIWHVRYVGLCGHQAISFDKKKILFLFGDYPKNFTKEEKALFDKENPYWANFFNKD